MDWNESLKDLGNLRDMIARIQVLESRLSLAESVIEEVRGWACSSDEEFDATYDDAIVQGTKFHWI